MKAATVIRVQVQTKEIKLVSPAIANRINQEVIGANQMLKTVNQATLSLENAGRTQSEENRENVKNNTRTKSFQKKTRNMTTPLMNQLNKESVKQDFQNCISTN
jgi:hypothetical protein